VSRPTAGATAGGDVVLPDVAGRAARLVFVDGAPAPAEVQDLPDGVIVSELGQALRDHGACPQHRRSFAPVAAALVAQAAKVDV
jgi:hypothetical protein